MKRKPIERTLPAFVPAPLPVYALGSYRLRDGALVTVKIVEWLATIRKYIYYLTKHTPSALLRSVSVVSEGEMAFLGATAQALEAA